MQKDLNDTEKERLLKDHEESMAKFEENLKNEQARTKEMLRKKLEERRKKKKSAEMGKIRDEYAGDSRAAEEEERSKLAALQTESAKVLTLATPSLVPKPVRTEEGKISCTKYIFISSRLSIINLHKSNRFMREGLLPI